MSAERSTRRAELARAAQPAAEALRLHPFYHGKIQMLPKCPLRAASRAIEQARKATRVLMREELIQPPPPA